MPEQGFSREGGALGTQGGGPYREAGRPALSRSGMEACLPVACQWKFVNDLLSKNYVGVKDPDLRLVIFKDFTC